MARSSSYSSSSAKGNFASSRSERVNSSFRPSAATSCTSQVQRPAVRRWRAPSAIATRYSEPTSRMPPQRSVRPRIRLKPSGSLGPSCSNVQTSACPPGSQRWPPRCSTSVSTARAGPPSRSSTHSVDLSSRCVT